MLGHLVSDYGRDYVYMLYLQYTFFPATYGVTEPRITLKNIGRVVLRFSVKKTENTYRKTF